MIILCDVDGVVCDLHGEWFRRYNERTGEFLHISQITSWEFGGVEVDKTVLFRILHDPDLYDHCSPILGCVWGVRALREHGHEVVFVTACNEDAVGQKMRWLMRFGLVHKDPDGNVRNFVATTEKHRVIGDVLIDDRPANLESFNGRKMLWDKPYNRGSDLPRFHSWREVVTHLCKEE